MMNSDVIFFMGPTGSGKSAMAIAIAKRLGNAEIVNADALQVYKGSFDIGTAKLSVNEQDGIPHHGFDLVEPGETFSAQDYIEFATRTISELHERGKVALIAGGSNMYLQALIWTSPLDEDKFSIDATGCGSWDDLYAIDPEKALKLHKNDTRRIENAIMGAKSPHYTPRLRYANCHAVVMTCDESSWMRARLDNRVDDMVKRGLVAEALRAMETFKEGKGVLQAIGYREFSEAVDLDDLDSILDKIKRDTWKYFRKQVKWNGKILKRLSFEPVVVKVNEATCREFEMLVDGVMTDLAHRRNKIDGVGQTQAVQRYTCEKCSIEFPGVEQDWKNHIKSSRHNRKRQT